MDRVGSSVCARRGQPRSPLPITHPAPTDFGRGRMVWVTTANGEPFWLFPHQLLIRDHSDSEGTDVGFKYIKHLRATQQTPQTCPVPGREAEMSKNAAGGYAFDLDDWALLDRFLILGTEGGTYYTDEHELTVASAVAVESCVKADGPALASDRGGLRLGPGPQERPRHPRSCHRGQTG